MPSAIVSSSAGANQGVRPNFLTAYLMSKRTRENIQYRGAFREPHGTNIVYRVWRKIPPHAMFGSGPKRSNTDKLVAGRSTGCPEGVKNTVQFRCLNWF